MDGTKAIPQKVLTQSYNDRHMASWVETRKTAEFIEISSAILNEVIVSPKLNKAHDEPDKPSVCKKNMSGVEDIIVPIGDLACCKPYVGTIMTKLGSHNISTVNKLHVK